MEKNEFQCSNCAKLWERIEALEKEKEKTDKKMLIITFCFGIVFFAGLITTVVALAK